MTQFTEEWASQQIARARGTLPSKQQPGIFTGTSGHIKTPLQNEQKGGQERKTGANEYCAPRLGQDRYRNKWERDYAQQLNLRRHIGEIVDFRYEGIAFRLADGTHLHPDFLVITPQGFEIHEVKGQRREKWWARFKIAVEMFPWFRWFVCSRTRGGTWELKERGR